MLRVYETGHIWLIERQDCLLTAVKFSSSIRLSNVIKNVAKTRRKRVGDGD